MIATSDEFLSAYMRLTHAAKPYFTRMAKRPLGRLEERYPKTVFLLFEAALKYVSKHPENSLPENAESSVIVDLLQREAGEYTIGTPEIIDNEGIKPDISEIDVASLWQLFYDYVVNLQTPSHATVELLLEKGKIEMAENVTLKLTHAYNKTRSLAKLIQYYLNQKNSEKAIALFALVPSTSDRRDEVSKIVSSLLEQQQFENALSFSKGLNDNELRAHALHEMSLWLTKQGKLENGLAILNEISDENDIKAYTLSLMIAILTSQGKFAEASQLALTIRDTDYRQDAINDIVKKMVRIRRMQEAEEFIFQLEGVVEKREASKILESGWKVQLQDQRIRKIQIF